MKKVILIIFILNLSIMIFCEKQNITTSYPVKYDVDCTESEVLINRNGDIYFFYLHEDKLILEKKKFDEDEFNLLQSDYFDDETDIISISRHLLDENVYALSIITQLNSEVKLYMLKFNISGNLELLSFESGNNTGSISSIVVQYTDIMKSSITFLQNNILQIYELFGSQIISSKIIATSVKRYNINRSLSGYYIGLDDSLNYFNIDNNNRYIDDLSIYDDIIIEKIIPSNEKELLLLLGRSDGYTLYALNEDNTATTFIDYPASNFYTPYITESKLGYFKFENSQIEIDTEIHLSNISEYLFIGSQLIYKTFDDSLFYYNLEDKTSTLISSKSVKDFRILNNELSSYLIIIDKIKEVFNLYIIGNDSIKFKDVIPNISAEIINLENVFLIINDLNNKHQMKQISSVVKSFAYNIVLHKKHIWAIQESYILLVKKQNLFILEVCK